MQNKADSKKYGFFSNAKKAEKLQYKADKARYKANKIKSKADDLSYKSMRAQSKLMKVQAKQAKINAKTLKWARQMTKTIGPMKMNEVTEEQLMLGRRYLGL